jgi:hypothetical protein
MHKENQLKMPDFIVVIKVLGCSENIDCRLCLKKVFELPECNLA